jgi:hypothetical protein
VVVPPEQVRTFQRLIDKMERRLIFGNSRFPFERDAQPPEFIVDFRSSQDCKDLRKQRILPARTGVRSSPWLMCGRAWRNRHAELGSIRSGFREAGVYLKRVLEILPGGVSLFQKLQRGSPVVQRLHVIWEQRERSAEFR